MCVCVCVCESLSHVHLFLTPWMIAHEVPLSMGFSRQEFRSGLPFPSPVDLLSLGIEPRSPALQADFYHLNHLSLSKVTTILPSCYYYFCLFLSFIWKESYHLYCFGFSLSLRLLVWDSFLLLHVACWLFSLLIVSLVLSCHNSVMFSTPERYLDKIMFWFGYYESIHENSCFLKNFDILLLGTFLEENVLDHSICTYSNTVKQFSKVIIPVYYLISIPVDFCPSYHLKLSFKKSYHFTLHFSGDFVGEFFTYLPAIGKSFLLNCLFKVFSSLY